MSRFEQVSTRVKPAGSYPGICFTRGSPSEHVGVKTSKAVSRKVTELRGTPVPPVCKMINLEITEQGSLCTAQACGKTFLEFESEGTG